MNGDVSLPLIAVVVVVAFAIVGLVIWLDARAEDRRP